MQGQSALWSWTAPHATVAAGVVEGLLAAHVAGSGRMQPHSRAPALNCDLSGGAAPHAAVAAEAAAGLPAGKRASVWLYNMLPTAQSADQLGQAGAADTVLARIVSGPGEAANSSFALKFVLPSGSLLAGKQARPAQALRASASGA